MDSGMFEDRSDRRRLRKNICGMNRTLLLIFFQHSAWKATLISMDEKLTEQNIT